MTVELVFITHNRLALTRKALTSVLADPSEEFSLTIWDNHSTDGTREFLRAEVDDPRIKDIVLCEDNVGQTTVLNQVWSASKADLLGKLDNDCLVTPGWTRILARAHADIDELGVVACWHFYPADFDESRAKHKIQAFGSHRIFRHPWTCGTGLLVKNETYRKLGPMTGRATTEYWLNMARAGYVNGFYYPLVFQEHMDDSRSVHSPRRRSLLHDDVERTADSHPGTARPMQDYIKYHESAVRSLRHHQDKLNNLLDDPYDPEYYSTWRRRLRKLRHANPFRRGWFSG